MAIVSVFIYYILRGRTRMVFLTLLSFLFISSFGINLLIYILAYTVANFVLGKFISNSKFKLMWFRIGIMVNLSQLFILKYASFAIDPFLGFMNYQMSVARISDIIIPVGISYFTLQGIGYLINLKMGWEKPEADFLLFSLYITFYPKFISGPVERSNHFLPQLKDHVIFDQRSITLGFRLIMMGLLKKLVIANQIGLIINPTYQNITSNDGGNLLFVLILQPLYLYFDFSGYTDIALGIARTYGFKLLPNFDNPFFAENVTTFWKKFHMSLSSWFNDYIFKQLSFKLRRYRNFATLITLFVTWTLFGIWHGAGWNFMVLGTLQAMAIAFEFFTKRQRHIIFSALPESFSKWTGRVITYFFYSVSLVFFFSPDISSALLFFNKLVTGNICLPFICNSITKEMVMKDYVSLVSFTVSFGVMILFLYFELISYDRKKTYNKMEELWSSDRKGTKIWRYILYYLSITFIFFYGGVRTDFIYFQF